MAASAPAPPPRGSGACAPAPTALRLPGSRARHLLPNPGGRHPAARTRSRLGAHAVPNPSRQEGGADRSRRRPKIPNPLRTVPTQEPPRTPRAGPCTWPRSPGRTPAPGSPSSAPTSAPCRRRTHTSRPLPARSTCLWRPPPRRGSCRCDPCTRILQLRNVHGPENFCDCLTIPPPRIMSP